MNKTYLASLTCLVCIAPARAQTPEIQNKAQTVLYVQRLQTKDGGFLPAATDANNKPLTKASLRATSSALRVLKYFGGKLADKDGCVKFVAACFDKASGGFSDTPGGKPDVVTTAVGVMAVAELGMPQDPYYSAAVKYLGDNVQSFDDVRIAAAALETLKTPGPKEKEWRDLATNLKLPAAGDEGRPRLLASKVVTLLRLGDKAGAKEQVVKELQSGQRSNGGYGKDESLRSDLETTYRVMRALWMLDARPPSVEGLHNFIHKCRNEDGGYAVAPGDPSSVSGTYYAAIITYWLDAKK
jgi:prenyltransferase beta subunit